MPPFCSSRTRRTTPWCRPWTGFGCLRSTLDSTWCSTSCFPISRSVMLPRWPQAARPRRQPRRRSRPRLRPPNDDRSPRMSMSNRAQRMLQHQMRHRADAELNLIPMIDILSVMVSFLLVYSTNVELLQNTKAIEIPQSIAEQQPRQTVVVMLTKDELFVQGEPIATVAEIDATDGDIIAPLREALKRPTLVGQEITEKDLAEREITVMGDKALSYAVLKKVMRTCTDADYGRISLAVLQKDKPVPPGTVGTS